MVPPPILEDIDDVLESYLCKPDGLPIHVNEATTRFWDRKPQPYRLLSVDVCPSSSTLNVERDPVSGRLLGFKEVSIRDAGTTSKNSTSLGRAPGPPGESTRGNTSNYPFWPGGFDEPDLPSELDLDLEAKACMEELENPATYLTCPPGFSRGVEFGAEASNNDQHRREPSSFIDFSNLLKLDDEKVDDLLGIWNADENQTCREDGQKDSPGAAGGEMDVVFDQVVGEGSEGQVLSISTSVSRAVADPLEWAEMVDTSKPFPDFYQQVPQLAFTWPFELDTFQKQAVLRLERNESVFVAAHTSAGKTVVAEYAVALSQRHMTRTIYTSPIKALSNQKFRDFRETFNDVGLVTGDIQINPSATCLIMTTEILRSMLYNGSDIIRDLEYVIFDEVHYINDSERGVVWEEVLILLPDHVNIIMLSATVPNTMEFADWVGRTKKKKIYVISTLKRPVPLEHFLYTGDSGKTKDELFLIQDSSGNFVRIGYDKAVAAKKARGENKAKTQFGPKGVQSHVGPKQEKNIWLTLVDHLSRKDKLPVVAFTLSRNRCDQNANLLTSLDLTTSVEKSDIHHFINNCVQKLKGTDRRLPQVLQLTELLKRGIGIHHSGILPILKEVVEMLFQRGLVKLLFATETFAMGVNMPARTVVFDNIKKHDGTESRILKPAEYIQMAGRAGRRGLDSTGTVIILCKQPEVYRMEHLHRMMLSEPTRLESKFRLTYSMILNLLRVEQLRVEDMIKRSFSESSSMQKQETHKKRLTELKTEVDSLPEVTGPFHQELATFATLATEFVEAKAKHWSLLLSHPLAVRALAPGRIIVFNHGNRPNRVGVLLSVDTKSRIKTYSVLIACDDDDADDDVEEEDQRLLQLISLASRRIGTDNINVTQTNHRVVVIKDASIVDITTKAVKIDAEKIFNDIKKREMPRFRDDPPGQSTQFAVQELNKYRVELTDGVPEVLNWVKDFKIQDLDLVGNLQRLVSLRDQISRLSCCADLRSDFKAQLLPVYKRRKLEDELKDTEFLLSEESLKYLPDYNQRLEVLKRLNYIDDNRRVRLKGRVACEMGSRELLITELVFDNLLTDRPPAEIAALLSCMVFQQKNCSAPAMTASLERGKADIEKCAEMIGGLQRECRMKVPDFVDKIHFGLVEVVYEWARGMPFSQITTLTDVQEGVIVRTIQRLDETLRDVKDAARVIGDPVLYQKMDESSTIIKRDIVFAASLYTQ